MDHVLTLSFQHLHTEYTDHSCFSILQLPSCLSSPKERVEFRLSVDQQPPSANQPQGAGRYEPLPYTVAQSTLLNEPGTHPYLILFTHQPSDSTPLSRAFGAELLQSSEGRAEIVCIKSTFDIFSGTSDIPLLIGP